MFVLMTPEQRKALDYAAFKMGLSRKKVLIGLFVEWYAKQVDEDWPAAAVLP